MPLFMDIHIVDSDSFSVEDVVKAHMQDLAIQDKFKVKQLKYWVNVEAKTIFCLMYGPDKEACNLVHLESHGNTACNIIEVADDEFNLFLGEGTDVNDLAQTSSGEIDTGYRTFILVNLNDFSGKHRNVKDSIRNAMETFQGTLILQPGNAIMASFIHASDAINCVLEIRKLIQLIPDKFEFVIAIASGKPVDEMGNRLFQDTQEKVQCLCAIGSTNTIYIDSDTQALSTVSFDTSESMPNDIEIVNNVDIAFLVEIYNTLIKNTDALNFKSKDLHASLGMSKSNTYRKMLSLLGRSPNQIITEFRLRQSLGSIIQNEQTIAEIGYSLGYNSPSYFTKVFQNRFKLTPTSFAQLHSSDL